MDPDDDPGLTAGQEQVVTQQEEEAPPPKGAPELKRLEDEKRPKLALKHNGEEFDVRSGLVELRDLRSFIGGRQEYLQALLDLANGLNKGLSEEFLAEARKDIFFEEGENGLSLREESRLILLSAVEQTPEGPVLSFNPFELRSDRDRLIVERAQRQADRRLRRMFGLGNDDPPIDEQEWSR